MKHLLVLISILVTFSFGESIYKKVDDSTNSGISKGTLLTDEQRPQGFLIRHPKDEVMFDNSGKVLDKDGNIKLIRLDIKFDFDKYEIKDTYKPQIDEAVQFLNKHESLKVTVEGHTDYMGTHEYNYILSEKRAKKVAYALRGAGVKEEKIEIHGFGETVPIADNKTEEGRAQNRRVDISFSK